MAKLTFKYPLVYIEWDDAEADNGWEEAPVDLKEAIAITVGFLVRETEKHLLIASSYDNHHTNGRLQIPRGMVKSMKVLYGVHKIKDKKPKLIVETERPAIVGEAPK